MTTLAPTPRHLVPPGQNPRLHCAGCGKSYKRDVRTAPDVHVLGAIGTVDVSWHRACYDAARGAPVSADDLTHTPHEGCGCDLCVATADELHAVADAHREAAIDAMEARADDFGALDPSAPLPWEDAFEPALHCLAPPRDPRPCVDCGRSAYVAQGERPYCLACVTHLLTLSLETTQKRVA